MNSLLTPSSSRLADALLLCAVLVLGAYVDKRGLTMTILVDGNDVGDLYEVPGTPAILLLDGNDNVVFGTLDSDPNNPDLHNAVDALMAERA